MAEPVDFNALVNGAELSEDEIVPGESGRTVVSEDDVIGDTETRGRIFDMLRPVNEEKQNKRERKQREKAEKPERKLPPRRKGSLVGPLTDLYTTIGTMLCAVDQNCGLAIVNSASKCAESMDKLAYENEAVRRTLYRLLETSAWGGVITAHSPIIFAVAIHHVPAVRNALGKMASRGIGDEAENYVNGQSE